jgi:GNAT superfamily N-acetyltransferase
MFQIIPYQPQHREEVISLVLNIQQNEFNVPVTLEGQPDLHDIPRYCQINKGNFWVAISPQSEVVGTICLLDGGDGVGVLRKMFVRADYRGATHGIAQGLLATLWDWAIEKGFNEVYLGTQEMLQAACRFYERNHFERVEIGDLPSQFPRMAVDKRFYRKKV